MAENGKPLSSWPLIRQLTTGDLLGLDGKAAGSSRTASLEARTKTADKVVDSVCPYCAVGCAQLVYVKDEEDHRHRRRSAFANFKRLPLSKRRRNVSIRDGSIVSQTYYIAVLTERSGKRYRSSKPWTWWPIA